MSIDYNKPYSFPRQKLPSSKKNKEWGIQSVESIIRLSSYNSWNNGISNNGRKKINYDLYNNIINKEDFSYVTNPYGLKEEFPARLNNYNIITPKIKLLEGEEIKRPFNFRVVAVNSDAVSQIEEKRKNLLLQYLESELVNELIAQGINVENPETGGVMTPEEVEKYMSYSDADIRESVANKLASYLLKKENLEYKFNKGFKDAMIAAEEIYYIGIEGGDPICEVVNPLDFTCDLSPDLDFIQDGQWGVQLKYCTPSQIIDAFYDELTDADVEKLDSGSFGDNPRKMGMGDAIGPITISNQAPTMEYAGGEGYIPVARVEWKSMRRIGFLKYYDENLEEQETIVDETYVAQKEKGEEVEWVWINETWEGTKIGQDIYVKIRPKTVQYRSMDNPAISKLGFVGALYNNRNSVATSLIDLVKHHQYLYNIIMYRLEFEVAKAKGKKMVMDLAMIPRSAGIDLEKWMYYFDSMGIAFINSFEEGKGKFQGQTSNFNQFTAIDMSLSQSVGQYISILDKIETMAADLIGVSRQRQGAISSSETVGGVERSVIQSSHITEPLFYMHNEIKRHVITQLIECAKFAYPEGKKINYILDDMTRVFLSLDEGFANADYGVFVTNSAKETKSIEDLKQIAQQAVASGIISLKELVSIFDSNSMADIKNTVERAEQRADQAKEREYQAQQDAIQAEIDGQAKIQETLQDRLDQREVIKGEIQKEISAIQALGFAEDKDSDSNGIPDVLEYEKLSQQAKEHTDKVSLEREKIKSAQDIAKLKAETDKYKADKSASKKPSSN